MAGRIGGIVSPQLTGLTSMPWLYPTVFGVACIFSGVLILFLPETAGKPMLNSLEEAELYYQRRVSVATSNIRLG